MERKRENEIIARVQAGMTGEFELLVRSYQNGLFRFAANLVERAIAEDLVQDIFLAAYAQIHTFDPRRGTFRAWIYRMARNRALNLRKKKKEYLHSDPPEMVDDRTPSRDLLTREAFRRLDQALNDLSFRDRVVFVLAELEGLPYAEIARIEDLALGTVKSRLARIKIKLRNILRPYVN